MNHHAFKPQKDLLNEGKRIASSVYESSVDKLNEVEDTVIEYSGKLVEGVKRNPVSTVLIFGGIGFLFSLLWRK